MRLYWYGAGSSEHWRRVAEKKGCSESVFFEGPSDDLTDRFLESGYLVFPSRVEGMSNVLLEAQAAGLPAVVSDIAGNTAVVQDGLNGQVVPVGDAEALSEALLALFRSPSKRAVMGRAARARMMESFAIEKVAARLEFAYEQALAGSFRGGVTSKHFDD